MSGRGWPSVGHRGGAAAEWTRRGSAQCGVCGGVTRVRLCDQAFVVCCAPGVLYDVWQRCGACRMPIMHVPRYVAQLMDSKKIAHYEIPIAINAELRQYSPAHIRPGPRPTSGRDLGPHLARTSAHIWPGPRPTSGQDLGPHLARTSATSAPPAVGTKRTGFRGWRSSARSSCTASSPTTWASGG